MQGFFFLHRVSTFFANNLAWYRKCRSSSKKLETSKDLKISPFLLKIKSMLPSKRCKTKRKLLLEQKRWPVRNLALEVLWGKPPMKFELRRSSRKSRKICQSLRQPSIAFPFLQLIWKDSLIKLWTKIGLGLWGIKYTYLIKCNYVYEKIQGQNILSSLTVQVFLGLHTFLSVISLSTDYHFHPI